MYNSCRTAWHQLQHYNIVTKSGTPTVAEFVLKVFEYMGVLSVDNDEESTLDVIIWRL